MTEKHQVMVCFELQKEVNKQMTNQKKINIVLEDDFGRVQTIIKTDLTPSDLMDKILEIVDD